MSEVELTAHAEPSTTYNESSFDVLEGLEPVRQVPGMYTRTKNPLHIAQEVIDNATDEAQAGFANRVTVTLHKDGSVTVADNGRGIPVGLHPVHHVPVVVLAFTRLHAGAKFRKGRSYSHSGGLHGVGVSVTNALSTRLDVTVYREGHEHSVHFEGGDRVISPVEIVGPCGPRTSGTVVRFWPDSRFFDSATIPAEGLESLLRAKAMLWPGLTMRLVNELTGETKTWQYADGMREYLLERVAGLEVVGELFSGEGTLVTPIDDASENGGSVEDRVAWALAWTQEAGRGESYVNMIPTPLGGSHEAGLRQGLFEAMRDYCEHHALLPRGVTLQAEDIWSRAHFILSAHLVNTQFQGQTKDKLTSREAVRIVSGIVKDPFLQWLLANPESSRKLADLAIKQASARLRQGKVIEKRKASGIATLPGKLTDCQLTDISRNELFLVEGDSAGGGAKSARDRTYQAVLPLRGKVLNTWEVPKNELFGNQEIHDISVALGVDPHDPSADNSVLDGLRYGKVIIMSDADVDGSHIQVLLGTLFLRHFPRLIQGGHVYVAKPPLFRLDVPPKGKSRPAQKIYCLSEQERDDTLDQLQREGFTAEQVTVSRFKGLGEMNPEQLKETTMSPDTRMLLQLYAGDAEELNRTFTLLMAKGEASSRRAWLEAKGNLADLDV